MASRNEDFYQRLRTRIHDWLESKGKGYKYAEYLLFAPDLFHVLARLTLDERVPTAERVKLGAVLAYFISPIDLVPEAALGPVGYIDDVALAAWALNGLINAGHGDVAREHWAGDGDLLTVIQRILQVADEALGAGLWRKIRKAVGL